MSSTVESLVLDLLEWLLYKERSYEETMDAWRTSCPRLPVWEEANDRGLICTDYQNGRSIVRVTPAGTELLKKSRPGPAHSPAEIHTLVCSAFNRGDAEALAALYETNALLMVDGKGVTGRENIRKAFESLLLRRGRMALETCSVIESAEGIAVLHGRWVVEYEAGLVTRGLSTEVLRKQPDGTWLFIIDNPNTPE